jgi:hypothetical protein
VPDEGLYVDRAASPRAPARYGWQTRRVRHPARRLRSDPDASPQAARPHARPDPPWLAPRRVLPAVRASSGSPAQPAQSASNPTPLQAIAARGDSPAARSWQAEIRCAHVEASRDVRCRLWPHDCMGGGKRPAGPQHRPPLLAACLHHHFRTARPISRTGLFAGSQMRSMRPWAKPTKPPGVAHREDVVSATQTLLTT